MVQQQSTRNKTHIHLLISIFVSSWCQERINEEIRQLIVDIERLGEPGSSEVKFGVLFDDDQVANYYEALVGTLKSAKKRGVVEYKGQMLLKGVSDDVVISIKDKSKAT